MKHLLEALACLSLLPVPAGTAADAPVQRIPYPIVDTGQERCYDHQREIAYPAKDGTFFGQDAQYQGNQPAYQDHGDGTVTDLVTGLVWSKAVDPKKVSLDEAAKIAQSMDLAGHRDWRVPTIKELFSLIDFRGYTGFGSGNMNERAPENAIPYIDTHFFDFSYGDVTAGERYIDAQWLSSTKYVSTTMDGAETLFGVNFADGRIKGYGFRVPRGMRPEKKFFSRYVRGPAYGENDFVDNRDGTITDRATSLQWAQEDSGKPMNWQSALNYAESQRLAGHSDWRLPNIKELQSIVDYTRSPSTTHSPAIHPVFKTTAIKNEAGEKDYPFFWSSTTHLDGPIPATNAAYISFGRAIGQMHGRVMDVHGAGAQRSDPKIGEGSIGNGPQGDARRVLNFVRCVRGGLATLKTTGPALQPAQQMGHPFGPEAPRRGFVSRLDRDADGKVSRREFDGPPDHFDVLDRDRDGFLSDDEAPLPPPQGGRPARR